MSTMGQRIREARKEAGLTQTQLATFVDARQQSISFLEKDKHQDTSLVVPIAVALNVNPVWLETGKGEKRSKPWNMVLDLSGLDADAQDAAREVVEAVKNGELTTAQLVAQLKALLMFKHRTNQQPS